MTSDHPEAASRSSIGAKRNPETETAILDAAAEIIAEKGVGGLRMEAVARRAKAGKATLYRWWPTKGTLLLAVYQRNKPEIDYRDTGSLAKDLKHFARDLQEIWLGENGLFFKAIIAEAQGDDDIANMLKGYHDERLVALTTLVTRAQTRGEFSSKHDAKLCAETVISLLWQRLITNRIEEDIDAHIDLLVDQGSKP